MCEEGLLDPFQDQVDCARFRAERDMLAQAMERVADDIERTFLGFEGAEDAPAMRWARQFRAALGSLHATSPTSHGDVGDVSGAAMSACDLLPEEEREAIAWVREHGGLPNVQTKCYLADEAAKAVTGESSGRSTPDDILDAMRRRLMPEGMEWPRYENGEPVLAGNVLLDANGEAFRAVSFLFTCDWWSVKGYQGPDFCTISKDTRRELSGMPYSRRVKRPAPKVLDANGVPHRKGDEVWNLDGTRHGIVSMVSDWDESPIRRLIKLEGDPCWQQADRFTHERPEGKCRDCAHWQKDPDTDNLGACWALYDEYEGVDCYPARRGDCGPCEEFERRAKALAERGAE